MTTKTSVTAKEIHADFYSAEERLYVEAIGLRGSLVTKTDKAKRLEKCGFGKTQPVKDCEQREKKHKVSGTTINVIDYFRTNYPFNKFITEDEVKRLCEKYGLLLGEAGSYIGDVPDKNLKEIEGFKLKKEDWKEQDFYSIRDLIAPRISPRFENGSWFLDWGGPDFNYGLGRTTSEKEQPKFKICAPKEDFDTMGWVVRDGYKLVYDPIVLQPVSKDGIDGYLIVTAWGEEASDEIVVNEKKN